MRLGHFGWGISCGLKRDLHHFASTISEHFGNSTVHGRWQVPFVECPAPGLEPFRELEELAAQLAEAKLPAATAAAATASAVPKVAPAQPKGHPVAPAQAKVPPALPPAVPAAVPSVPTISRPEGVGLSHGERALRSLLEFFACSDVERKGQDALFNCKYREFLGVNEPPKKLLLFLITACCRTTFNVGSREQNWVNLFPNHFF